MNIGNVWRKGLLLGILLLLVLIGSAQAENFTVRVEKDIIGFDENQITVETDQTGLLTLTLSDNYGTYRTITREAKRGTTTFMWDGLGENEERLPSGSYTLHALLVTARGNQETQINVTNGRQGEAGAAFRAPQQRHAVSGHGRLVLRSQAGAHGRGRHGYLRGG